MFIDKLFELNKCELGSTDGYKYIITTYEDETIIEYIEKDIVDGKMKSKGKYNIPSCHDIQICEKIIELRKTFNNK